MTDVTPEQAAQVLKDEQRKRAEAFAEAYAKLCEKHGCEIIGIPVFTNDGRAGVQLQVRTN